VRLIGYKRVSGIGQVADGFGLAIQDQALRSWAKANGHRLIRIEEDEGVSGAKDAVDRPGLSAALLAVQEREAEGLLVPKLDRLARALTVQEATLGFVWRAGGRVFAADSGEILQDDPDDPMRTALRQVVGVFAELDRRIVVKRLKDGRTAKAKTGRKSVGSYAYGYQGQGKGRQRDAAPRPDEQAAVARILQLREAGDSYRAIAETLDAEGLKPRRAASWSAMSVRAVVQRAKESSGPRP
jgi:DNA invertase Pin-like site-specific DNA recombinase